MKYTFLIVETISHETLVDVEADTHDEAEQMAVAGETVREHRGRMLEVINRVVIGEVA